MLNRLCKSFWLLSFCSCASLSRKPAPPMENCFFSLDDNGASFSCVDLSGKPYTLFLKDAAQKELVCFPEPEFKTYAEACHPH